MSGQRFYEEGEAEEILRLAVRESDQRWRRKREARAAEEELSSP